MSDTINLGFRLCGGISTVEQGFSFATATIQNKVIHFLCNSRGQMFARFFEEGRRVESANDLSRGELEAIEGFKILILGWPL
jgi:hypothetical protein